MERPLAVQLLQECQKYADAFLNGEPPEQEELENLAKPCRLSASTLMTSNKAGKRTRPCSRCWPGLCGTHEPAQTEPAVAEILESEPDLLEAGQKAEPFRQRRCPSQRRKRARCRSRKPPWMPSCSRSISKKRLKFSPRSPNASKPVSADAFDREALTVIRRSFHTLKGSGRMVGLFNLGDVAWAIEQVMNKLPQLEKPAPAALLDLVDEAHMAFSGWVDDLHARGKSKLKPASFSIRPRSCAKHWKPKRKSKRRKRQPRKNPRWRRRKLPQQATSSSSAMSRFLPRCSPSSRRSPNAICRHLKRGVAMLAEQERRGPGLYPGRPYAGGHRRLPDSARRASCKQRLNMRCNSSAPKPPSICPLIDQAVATPAACWPAS